MILGLYGASGLGMEYLMAANLINTNENKWSDIIFVDDTPEKNGTVFLGRKVFSFSLIKEMYSSKEIEFIIAMGEPLNKDMIYTKLKKYGYCFGKLIHPSAYVSDTAELGDGVVIMNWNSIPPKAKLGNNVLIQGTTCLGHGLEIGDNSVVSSFVFIGGETKIGRNTYIAPHSCLRNGITIGDNTIIGMGSVVTKDIPANVVAYGNPCEVKRINEKGRVFSK